MIARIQLLLLLLVAATGCMHAPQRVVPAVHRIAECPVASAPQTLRVMTVNLAHGRGDGMNQLLRQIRTLKVNLICVAEVLKREQPQVVALQEADKKAFWSGSFSHVQYLAGHAQMAFAVESEHVAGMGLHYGTGLLSQVPLVDPLSFTFKPSPPTFAKGFTVAAVTLAGGREVDVVAVHLDFSRHTVRQRQIREMIAVLRARQRPQVIMGDFNCQWQNPKASLHELVRELNLHTWKPEAPDIITFPPRQTRLDYILVSPELEIVAQEVLTDVISDHRAVLAEVRFAAASVPGKGQGK